MTNTKHTPAPWTVNHDDGETIGILGNNGKNARGQQYVAAIQYSEKAQAEYLPNIPSHNEARANARLIAAAPELLAILELAARYLKHPDVLEITKQMAMSGEALNERIDAAIAKATGEVC